MTTSLKRWTALVLVALLCAMAFAACAEEENEPERGESLYAGSGEEPNIEEPGEDPGEIAQPEDPDGVVAGIYLREPVVDVEGVRPILWEEIYYDLHVVGGWLLQNMMMQGTEDWDDLFLGSELPGDVTFTGYALHFALEQALSRRAVEFLFLEAGERIDPQDYEEMKQHYMEMWGVDEVGFSDILWEHHFTDDVFRYMNEVVVMYQTLLNALFEEDGDITDADAIAFAEELGVMRTIHILLMATAEDDDEVKAQADEIYAELRTLSGNAFYRRFDELVAEIGEDPGMERSPQGYTFLPGVMVTEFYEAARELEFGEMSPPVRSHFGYHIILRLPLLIDELVMLPGPGAEPMPIRELMAQELLDDAIEAAREALRYTRLPVFDQIAPGDLFHF